MLVIQANNINYAWDQARWYLNSEHVVRPSRVGQVWEYPTPVMTVYHEPTQRVLFDPARNANPYFHLFEALWMLAGREDVEWIAKYLPRMREFSDNGVTFHGAYGYRWRNYFLVCPPEDDKGAHEYFEHYTEKSDPDQLNHIVAMLRRNPEERRAVLTMFNPETDLDNPSCKDIPCNTQAYFKIRDGQLDITVSCRSNDIAWGAYGSNVVHFSMLLEYMAARIGVPVGRYYHLSDSWHAYTERWEKLGGFVPSNELGMAPTADPYANGWVRPYPLVEDPETWDDDLELWMLGETEEYANSFFSLIATPMRASWEAWKAKDTDKALACLHNMPRDNDWRLATQEWLERYRSRDQMRLFAKGGNVG